jgi:serralysin
VTTLQNTLGAGSDTLSGIENLTGSAFRDVLTGNASANTLIGGGGNDVLTGGAGTDVLLGEDGDDIFVVAVAGDMASDETVTGGAGTDELRFAATAPSTLTIGSGVSVEKVVIGTGTAAAAVLTGAAALNVNASSAANGRIMIGNAGANILTGSAFNDTLEGGAGIDTISAGVGDDVITGGLGADTLTGGSGSDTFIFNSTLGATNIDRIQDFSVVDDMIHLENTGIFSALTSTGVLASGAFNTGTRATEADDRIIYDSASGKLFYDSDGNGSAAAVQFATLTSGLTLTNADFWVI